MAAGFVRAVVLIGCAAGLLGAATSGGSSQVRDEALVRTVDVPAQDGPWRSASRARLAGNDPADRAFPPDERVDAEPRARSSDDGFDWAVDADLDGFIDGVPIQMDLAGAEWWWAHVQQDVGRWPFDPWLVDWREGPRVGLQLELGDGYPVYEPRLWPVPAPEPRRDGLAGGMLLERAVDIGGEGTHPAR